MSASDQHRQELLRILGAGFGVAVTVGGTVGVGILRTPGLVAAQIPSVWGILVLWVLGGLYALIGTVCVVELATMLPEAGGWYVYARRAFGEFGGFVVGWSDWLAQSAALAYLSTAIGEFAVAFLVASLAGDTTHSLYAIALMALSYPVYRAISGSRASAQAADSG